MTNINPLFATDSYKLGHPPQYPDGTTSVYSNGTPRSLKHSPIPKKYSDGKIVVFGLQGVMNELVSSWNEDFFKRDKKEVCDEFLREVLPFVGPNGFDISRVEALHDLGYLPIRVKALPEGSKINVKIPMFTIVNTLPEFFWVTNYLETILSAQLWKSFTVATIANAYRRILTEYAIKTGTDLGFVDFQGHDFSSRGLSGLEDIMKTGSAHLTSFKGTDSLPALHYLNEHYDGKNTFKGASVPATEHSVMCLGGNEDVETTHKETTAKDAIKDFKDEFPKFYELGMGFINNTNTTSGTEEFSSKETDGSQQVYAYMTVTDGEIVSVGNERIVEGGTFWIKDNSNSLYNSSVNEELLTFERLVTEIYPNGNVSIVSDTWDFWEVITNFLPRLKGSIMKRGEDAMGMSKVIIRPDSGDPEDIICGTAIVVDKLTDVLTSNKLDKRLGVQDAVVVRGNSYFNVTVSKVRDGNGFKIVNGSAEIITPTPEMKGAIECLWETFGGTKTDTGYKLLDSHIGLVYGDSITLKRADEILSKLAAKGFASGNVVLGIGAYSYQFLTRDTFGFAMKATHGIVNGVSKPIFKQPKTDDGTKHSAKGLLCVGKDEGGEFVLYDDVGVGMEAGGFLKTVFEDGVFTSYETLEIIRERLLAQG